jgi:hypothetical protein
MTDERRGEIIVRAKLALRNYGEDGLIPMLAIEVLELLGIRPVKDTSDKKYPWGWLFEEDGR